MKLTTSAALIAALLFSANLADAQSSDSFLVGRGGDARGLARRGGRGRGGRGGTGPGMTWPEGCDPTGLGEFVKAAKAECQATCGDDDDEDPARRMLAKKGGRRGRGGRNSEVSECAREAMSGITEGVLEKCTLECVPSDDDDDSVTTEAPTDNDGVTTEAPTDDGDDATEDAGSDDDASRRLRGRRGGRGNNPVVKCMKKCMKANKPTKEVLADAVEAAGCVDPFACEKDCMAGKKDAFLKEAGCNVTEEAPAGNDDDAE